MGFYFGAGDAKNSQMTVSATLEGTTVIANVVGGTPPFKITAMYGPKSVTKSEESKDGWARLAFDRTKDNIAPLQISATDSKNSQASAPVPLDKAKLKADQWALPE